MRLIVNQKATFEYELGEKYLAGVVLTGGEVKSIRQGKGSLTGSFVRIVGNEVFLLNAQINPYPFANNRDYDPRRTRKLLLSRHEITQLMTAQEKKGSTLVPLALVVVGRHIKLEFAVGRGKKQYEKRAAIKKRDVEREIASQFKHKVQIH